MPVYTFKCQKCNQIFDEFMHSYDIYEMECNCPKKEMSTRIISKPARAKFSGTGFYETDYKNTQQ